MQAAMNPLLSILGAGPEMAGGAPLTPGGASQSGFPSLLANLAPGVQVDGVAPIEGQGLLSEILPLLKDLKTAFAHLQGLSESTEFSEAAPEGLFERLEEGLSTLSGLLEQLQEIVGANVPVNFQSGVLSNADGKELGTPTQPMNSGAGILAILQSVQATSQRLAQEIAPFVAGGGDAESALTNEAFGLLQKASNALQVVMRPATPGQHPVSLALSIDQPNTNAAPMDAGDDGSLRPFGSVEFSTPANAATAPAGPFQAAAFDVPKEFTQVIAPEPTSIVAPQSELSETNRQTAAQQLARPDAPQAKFSQAIVSQLRTVDFQEGTTKVELTPRGLGTVEVEMKTNSDGSLSVVVRADNAHVLSSLREERDLLAQVIGQSGGASVDFQEFSSDQGQQFDQSGGFASEGSEGATVETDERALEPTATIGNGQLDLMT